MTCLGCDPSFILKQLGLTPAPLLVGWADGLCFKFDPLFSLQCRYISLLLSNCWTNRMGSSDLKREKQKVCNPHWKHSYSLQPTTSAAIHQIIPWLGCLLFLNNVFAPSQRLPNSPLAWPTYSALRSVCRAENLSSRKKLNKNEKKKSSSTLSSGGEGGWAAMPVTVSWWARGGWPHSTRDKVVQRLPPSGAALTAKPRWACPRADREGQVYSTRPLHWAPSI